jgi:hypothetical protein
VTFQLWVFGALSSVWLVAMCSAHAFKVTRHDTENMAFICIGSGLACVILWPFFLVVSLLYATMVGIPDFAGRVFDWWIARREQPKPPPRGPFR